MVWHGIVWHGIESNERFLFGLAWLAKVYKSVRAWRWSQPGQIACLPVLLGKIKIKVERPRLRFHQQTNE